MKKVLLVLGLLGVLYISAQDSKENVDTCYFDTEYGLDKRLVSSVLSEEVIKFARYEGAKTSGVFLSKVESGEETIVKVKATLTAKNGFGVSSKTSFIIEASLKCYGYSVISVNKVK